jgi:hypothetical protein
MEVTIPQELIYNIDKVNYNQRMAIDQLVFMLTYHINDVSDDFLSTDIFQRLHLKLITSTAQRWCMENVVVKEVMGTIPKKFKIEAQNALIIIEEE